LKISRATVKSLHLPSEETSNEFAAQTRFCQSQAFQVEKNKKGRFGIFSKVATLHVTSDCMRPPLLGRGNCCVTRPGVGFVQSGFLVIIGVLFDFT